MNADTGDLRRLAADLGGSQERVGRKVASILRDTASKVEASARAATPVDTGELRDSITTDFRGDGRSLGMTAWIGPTAMHGRFVEYGTASIAPRPFMAQAVDAHREDFERQIADALGDIL